MLLPEKVFLSWLHLSPDLKEGVLLGGVSLISFPGGSVVKNLSANAGEVGSIPGWKDPLGKKTATHSIVLAWRIPWTEEPGGLQSVGSQIVRHDLVSKQHWQQ